MTHPQVPTMFHPDAPTSVTPQLLRGVASLADLAAASGRDAASSLLQGILRDLQAKGRSGA